jgi:hypothetical protein
MKKFIAFFIFFLSFCNVSISQYYDTSTMSTIHLNRTAAEGDLYLDTVNKVYRIGLTNGQLGFLTKNYNWHKIGTSSSAFSITDSIFTKGLVQLTDYPDTRADDTSAYLNVLYTDNSGNIKSGRREIIPPSPFINISVASTGNTFDYYSYYNTKLTTAGLSPIPLANLDFYVFAFDPAVFDVVSINTSGVLSFNVLSNAATTSCIDVRFYTK